MIKHFTFTHLHLSCNEKSKTPKPKTETKTKNPSVAVLSNIERKTKQYALDHKQESEFFISKNSIGSTYLSVPSEVNLKWIDVIFKA